MFIHVHIHVYLTHTHHTHTHHTHTHTPVQHTQPSRPPPALLHIPSTAETSSATPPQSRVQADSATSSVIQQAPPRTTPTTIAESATAATVQRTATPIATPSVMFHPSILAAAALQQQASQSASSNPGAATSSAPSVMEALQQQIALGRGVSAAVSGATATPAVNPFGAALVSFIAIYISLYLHKS